MFYSKKSVKTRIIHIIYLVFLRVVKNFYILSLLL